MCACTISIHTSDQHILSLYIFAIGTGAVALFLFFFLLSFTKNFWSVEYNLHKYNEIVRTRFYPMERTRCCRTHTHFTAIEIYRIAYMHIYVSSCYLNKHIMGTHNSNILSACEMYMLHAFRIELNASPLIFKRRCNSITVEILTISESTMKWEIDRHDIIWDWKWIK